MSAETIGVGRDYQSRNPSTEMWLSFRPRLNLYGSGGIWGEDDSKNRLNINGRIDATKEFANDDSSTQYRQWLLGDTWINLTYSRSLVKRNGWATSLQLGPRALLPTSLSSQANGVYSALGGGVGLLQMIPLNRGSDWFASARVLGSVYYTHAFSEYTTPTMNNDLAQKHPRMTAASSGMATFGNQMSSRLLAKHQMMSVIDTGLQITPKLGLTVDTIFIQRWSYRPTEIGGLQIANARLTEDDLKSASKDPQNYGMSIYFLASVDYQLTNELNLSATYYSYANTIGPSGQRQSMFYAPESSRFSLTATVGLDALYERFLGDDSGKGSGAQGSRIAQGNPLSSSF